MIGGAQVGVEGATAGSWFVRALVLPVAIALGLLFVAGCGEPSSVGDAVNPGVTGAPDEAGFSAPSERTRKANAAFGEALALADPVDFEEAERGLVGRDAALEIVSATGRRWSPSLFAFVDPEGPAPASVNPSLWRQAKLNGRHGLYQVADGLYQVRGYDVSNMSWIRGQTGWIVVDPLSSVESARAAVGLARQHLGDDPIVAVIFTHSHVDHFQGVAAVLPADAQGTPAIGAAGDPTARVRIIAPARFVEEVTSENVLAGTAMGRRVTYQFGFGLPYGERGYVDSGLGKQPLTGSSSFAVPTDAIDRTPQPMTIDGVELIFQYTPESEAPAELAFYLPKQKAYCGAQIVNRTKHNHYTL
ncbi:MBL fold metallo-hydrolase, partial [Myxococcota bacterium]|nr:MBL fold metallo-hydrolase [Myxococcota bacterium]